MIEHSEWWKGNLLASDYKTRRNTVVISNFNFFMSHVSDLDQKKLATEKHQWHKNESPNQSPFSSQKIRKWEAL